MAKTKTCRIKIQNYCYREKIIEGLANSGYKVWVEEPKKRLYETQEYYVCFEYQENNQ